MSGACPACAGVPLPQDFDDGTNATAPKLQYSLPDIHCAACIGKIERGLSGINGVSAVRVNLSLKRLSVSGTMDPTRIEGALRDLGFDAYPLDLEALNTARDTVGRGLLTRMAVAGFAMMNVMLLSIAVWSGACGIRTRGGAEPASGAWRSCCQCVDR